MDKRYLITIGVIAGLIIAGLIVFWLTRPSSTPSAGTSPTGLFPSGGTVPLGQTNQPTGQAPVSPGVIPAGQQKTLTQLTQKAVSGATFIEKQLEDKTKVGVVRYIEKATGHIYDIDLQRKTSDRISNTTIPGIFKVYWSSDGNQAIVRYAETNETGISDNSRNFSITSLTGTTTRGVFLLSSVGVIASSPKENKIFYFAPWENANIGLTAAFDGKKQKQIFSTPFGDFLASWPNENVVALISRPSFSASGYLYKLDPISGSLERILGGIKGLTALWSPDNKRILYSASDADNGVITYLYNLSDRKTSLFFSIKTLPEKCAWSKIKEGIIYCAVPLSFPSAQYPDDWYQGLVSFGDRIWKIDIINGKTEIISNESQSEMDIISPFLSKNEDYLLFQNKKDGTLWSLQI